MVKRGTFWRARPVSGSNSRMVSISSSSSSMRTATSACSAGNTSIVSPRTRKVPRTKSLSLRRYCIAASRTMMSRWPIRSWCRSTRIIEW